MATALTEKNCTPCRGGIPRLTPKEAGEYRAQTPEWALVDDATRIERTYRFKNFGEAFAFVSRAAKLAEAGGTIPTSASAGATRRSRCGPGRSKACTKTTFIMAAKLDRIAEQAQAVRQDG